MKSLLLGFARITALGGGIGIAFLSGVAYADNASFELDNYYVDENHTQEISMMPAQEYDEYLKDQRAYTCPAQFVLKRNDKPWRVAGTICYPNKAIQGESD